MTDIPQRTLLDIVQGRLVVQLADHFTNGGSDLLVAIRDTIDQFRCRQLVHRDI